MSGKSPKNIFVWIVFGLLAVGLMGFGATGFSGTGRSLGKAGDTDISVQSYRTALGARLAAERAADGTPMPIATAQAQGVTGQVLSKLVTDRVLDNETTRLGLSVGDNAVLAQIVSTPEFSGPDGTFDREIYGYQLARIGQTEAGFESEIRADMSRSLLQRAVLAGMLTPAGLVDAIVAHSAQTRTVSWVELTETDLTAPIPTPDESDLRAFYDANQDQFMAPESREISAAILLPEMLRDRVELDETDLRALYDQQIDIYQQPERRLVERLIFSDQDKVDAAFARLTSGEVDFDALVAERGLDLSNVDLGDVSRADLGDAAEAVFATEPNQIAGPVPTPLGPALFRVNAILAGQDTPFEDALPALRAELGMARATRQIAHSREQIQDLIAGGAAIEDLAERTDMEQRSFSWSTGSTEGLAAYGAIADALPGLNQGDFPSLIELEDGGLAVLRLDAITPATPIPFGTAMADLATAWRADALAQALDARATEITAALENGSDFADLGLTQEVIVDMARSDVIASAPNGFHPVVFETDPGVIARVSSQGREAILRVDSIADGPTDSPDLIAGRAALESVLSQSFADDLLTTYAQQLQMQTDVTVDQGKVAAIHAQYR